MPNLTAVLPCLKRLGRLYDTLAFSLLGKIGPVGLRQLLNTILDRQIPACFRIGYRHINRDHVRLGMLNEYAGCPISN